MRKLVLVFILCLGLNKAYSQYNYYRLSAGANVGANTAFADLEKKKSLPSASLNLDYHLTPFSSIGIELQKGSLSGGDRKLDAHGRYFKNDYMAFSVGGKLQLGQIVDFESSNFLYAIRGLYSGIGVGMVKNNIKDANIVRIQDKTGYEFPGTNKSTSIAIPINAGINFNLLDRWGYTRYILNLNYQFNVTTGEGLDGYNDASRGSAWSSIPDMYGVASVGLRICFGPEGLY